MRPVAAVVFGQRFGENGGDSIVGMVEGGPEARQREAVQPPVKKYFYINDFSTFLYMQLSVIWSHFYAGLCAFELTMYFNCQRE
jgi:hypothetical protein